MKDSVLAYYKSEYGEAVFMFLWGTIVTCATIWGLFQTDDPFWKGMAYTILPLSALQLFTGLRNLVFVNKRKRRMLNGILQEFKNAIKKEKLRILNVQIKLRFYRTIEQILFALGFIFIFSGGVFGLSVFLAGSGIGLMIQSAILLIQDLFAEWRAGIYLEELIVKENS